MSKVKIVEALCGCGKTHWAIDMMSANSGEQWLFVTPFLDEAGESGTADEFGNYGTPIDSSNCRVRDQAPQMNFKCPADRRMVIEVKEGETVIEAIQRLSALENKKIIRSELPPSSNLHKLNKTQHLMLLLLEGHNVSITHALFLNMTKETLEVIKERGINIVIDETVDKIDVFSNNKALINDVKNLTKLGVISIHENGKLVWDGDHLSQYNDVYELCEEGVLYLHNENLLIKRFSSLVYESAKEVFILTYMFHHSPMRVWMQACGIKWEYLDVTLKVSTEERIAEMKNLITIEKVDTSLLGQKSDNSSVLSSSWYKRQRRENPQSLVEIRQTANKLYYRWRKRLGKPPEIMYTTFLKYSEDVAGKGTREVDFESPSLVPKNARASNKHDSKSCLLYWVNVYPLVDLKGYLDTLVPEQDRLDSDKYALSEMIQWVFRSAIRKGEPINIFIASNRMRKLFEDWLNGR